MSRLFVPLDVEFASDPKILEAGHTAAYLYIVALAHCKRTMSNGEVHRAQLRMLAAGLPGSSAKHASRLCNVGLWVPTENGWHVVAWEKHNASREEIEMKRAMASEDGERGAHTRWHVPPNGSPSAKCRICVTQRLVDSRTPPEPHSPPHSPLQCPPIAKEEVEVEPEVEPETQLLLAPTPIELAIVPEAPNGARKRDPIFDALIDACGYSYDEMTDRQRKACGVARAELARVNATPELIHQRAAIYRQKHPAAALTPNALASQWAALTVNGVATPRLSESSQALARAYQRRQGAP